LLEPQHRVLREHVGDFLGEPGAADDDQVGPLEVDRPVERHVLERDLELHRPGQVREPLRGGEVLDGDDRPRVAGLLLQRRGQVDAATVGAHYRHTTPEMLAQVVEVVEAYLRTALASVPQTCPGPTQQGRRKGNGHRRSGS
jgi:hypothetical protein